jgi:hypothetical protein
MAEYESEIAELLEGLESESAESEAAERAGRWSPPKTPPRGGLRPVSRPPGFVTRVELTTAMARLDGKINTVSEGIKTVNNRLNTVNAEKGRVSAALKKESDERKKDSDSIKKNLNSQVQMLALLPLLVPPPTYSFSPALQTDAAGNVTAPTATAAGPITLSPGQTSLTNALLPILLISGFGGSGGLGSSSDGGMDSTMLLTLALVLSQQRSS